MSYKIQDTSNHELNITRYSRYYHALRALCIAKLQAANKYYEKQNAFNEKIALAKQDFEIFNQKASNFDQRRTEFNARLTEYKDKCAGDRKLVK
jgi:hypothetical protein